MKCVTHFYYRDRLNEPEANCDTYIVVVLKCAVLYGQNWMLVIWNITSKCQFTKALPKREKPAAKNLVFMLFLQTKTPEFNGHSGITSSDNNKQLKE